MSALIFFCILGIFLNIISIAFTFYIISEDLNGTALREKEDYVHISPSNAVEGRVFSGDEALDIFPGLMPEMVRYAKHRCRHDLPKVNVHWGAQIFSNEAEAHDTHCYVKCFLRRVGLIRLDTLDLDFYRFAAMLYNIGGNQSFPENCLEALYIADELNGKCEPYYNVWIQLLRHCHLAFNYIFYYNVRLEELPFVKPLPLYRERGVDPFQFCSAVLKEDIDLNSPEFAFCIYLQLHYFDSYGRIDTSEIIHSFAGSGRSTAFNEDIIKKCAHLANAHFMGGENSKEMAQQMAACLTRSTPDDYLFVLQYWNQVMRDY